MSTVELTPLEVAVAHVWSIGAGIVPRDMSAHLPPSDDQAVLSKVVAGETVFTVADVQRLWAWGSDQPETDPEIDLYTKLGEHLDAAASTQ